MKVLPHAALLAFADGQQLLFQFLTLGHIAHDADHAAEAAGLFPNGKTAIQHPAHRTIGAHDAVGMLITLSRDWFREELPHAGPVLGVNRFEPGAWIGVE